MSTVTGINMKANGRIILSMVMENNNTKTAMYTLEIFWKVGFIGTELLHGLMKVSFRENFSKVISMAKVNGLSLGLILPLILLKEDMNLIRKMVMVFLLPDCSFVFTESGTTK